MCFTVLCSKSVILTVNQCWERVEISFCVKRKSLIIQKNIKYNKEIKKRETLSDFPLRREGDSNPRNAFDVYTLSRRASSATRAPLLGLLKMQIQ